MSEEEKKPPVRPKPTPKKVKEEKPLPPSPKQPFVEQLAKQIQERFAPVESAYINQPNDHLPTLIISRENWLEVASFLKTELSYTYIQNISAVDYETYFEVVYHLRDITKKERLAVKVKVDREKAQLPTVSHLFPAANWNEREMYDLMGIQFQNHPNLKRILMPDDWVGYPLRKDYEPFDKEV